MKTMLKKFFEGFFITIAIFISIVVGFPIIVFLFMLSGMLGADFPFTSGVVASTTSSEGVEGCIVQYYKNIAEPYQVSFYAKYPGGKWRWYYLAHESGRWRNAEIDIKKETAFIYKRGNLNRVIPVEKFPLNETEYRNFPGDLNCRKINQAHRLKLSYPPDESNAELWDKIRSSQRKGDNQPY